MLNLLLSLGFSYIFMVSMNGFVVGGGITRDGLELVGERYGVCTSSLLVLYPLHCRFVAS
jgi:hypothetical protein